MTKLLGVVLAVSFCIFGLIGPSRAADATALLDKAIQAIGGEEKLGKIQTASWKTKGTISFGGNDNPVTTQATAQGLDHLRQEFESEFNGNQFKAVSVLAGDKGWRVFGDNHSDMDKDAVTNEKRSAYLTLVPITIVPLKGKDFKVETIAAEEKVADKPAVGVKVTPPDGKTFNLYFDKESGLPVRLVAKVIDFMGTEFTQETTFSDYKEMAGIKKATKVISKRDGEKFIEQEITEFTVVDKVDPKTFDKPE